MYFGSWRFTSGRSFWSLNQRCKNPGLFNNNALLINTITKRGMLYPYLVTSLGPYFVGSVVSLSLVFKSQRVAKDTHRHRHTWILTTLVCMILKVILWSTLITMTRNLLHEAKHKRADSLVLLHIISDDTPSATFVFLLWWRKQK